MKLVSIALLLVSGVRGFPFIIVFLYLHVNWIFEVIGVHGGLTVEYFSIKSDFKSNQVTILVNRHKGN